MNDDLLLSLHLDGRLSAADAIRLEERLAAEPALRDQLAAMRRLQRLSAGLPTTEAGFGPDHIRMRASRGTKRHGWRYAAAAAAALLLAATHMFAFRLGADQPDAGSTAADPIESAERLFARAARIDPASEPAMLRTDLDDLETEIQTLQPELIALTSDDTPPAERRRAVELSHALDELEGAFVADDVGFVGFTVRAYAQGRVGLLPATAQQFARVMPAVNGRVRIVIFTTTEGRPSIVTDEGTPEELEGRHTNIQFISHKDK